MSERDRSARSKSVSASYCDAHQKQRFLSRKAARIFARRVGRDDDGRLHAYRCEELDGYWHLGHLPARVRRGHIGREDIRPAEGVSR